MKIYKLRYVGLTSLLVFLYFCLPKIDLFNIPGAPTGIRTQDLISLILLFNQKTLFTLSRILKNQTIFFTILSIFTINLMGSIYFGTLFEFVLGWIRLFQYFIVGIATFHILVSNYSLFITIIFFQAIFSVMQFFKFLPVIDPGRGFLRTTEYAGTFGTAAELAYFCTILSIVLLSVRENRTSFLVVLLPIFSGVRAYFLTVPFYLFARTKSLILKILLLLPFFAILIGILVYFYDLLMPFARSIQNLVLSTPPSLDNLKSIEGLGSSEDIALGQRIGKWSAALSLLTKSSAAFFGTGLYSLGGTLDGGILRMLTELGIPITLFILFKLIRIDFLLFSIFIIINLFFDGFISSVTMPIFIGFLLFKTFRIDVYK